MPTEGSSHSTCPAETGEHAEPMFAAQPSTDKWGRCAVGRLLGFVLPRSVSSIMGEVDSPVSRRMAEWPRADGGPGDAAKRGCCGAILASLGESYPALPRDVVVRMTAGGPICIVWSLGRRPRVGLCRCFQL